MLRTAGENSSERAGTAARLGDRAARRRRIGAVNGQQWPAWGQMPPFNFDADNIDKTGRRTITPGDMKSTRLSCSVAYMRAALARNPQAAFLLASTRADLSSRCIAVLHRA